MLLHEEDRSLEISPSIFFFVGLSLLSVSQNVPPQLSLRNESDSTQRVVTKNLCDMPLLNII